MDVLEKVARAIAWAQIKDKVASTNYSTGEKKYIRDITNERDMYVEPEYFAMAQAAIDAMKVNGP